MQEIYCLFSIANDYDQPSHNLEAWWPEKPTIEQLARVLEWSWPGSNDAETLKLVKLWEGKEEVKDDDYTLYRIEKVASATNLQRS